MGVYSGIARDPLVEPQSRTAQRLLALRSKVASDGSATRFTVAVTNIAPFVVKVPFADMANVFAEIRHAQATMARRQNLALDRGAGGLLELCELALRPVRVDFRVDPVTGDILCVHQFDDHAPVALRVSPADAIDNVGDMMQVVRQSRH